MAKRRESLTEVEAVVLYTEEDDPVSFYAQEVLAGRIIAGPQVREACKRHLRDLKDGPSRGLRWDVELAKHKIAYFPGVLRLTEGEFFGQPFKLELWQQFIIGSLFGWLGDDGFRRFRMAYIEVAKGNGKALALDTPIPTPTGWTTMGELKVGDEVFDENGLPCNVIGATPVMKNHECFNVGFSCGNQIIADADHIWQTTSLRSAKGKGYKSQRLVPYLRTTREIAETLTIKHGSVSARTIPAKWNHRVDVAGALQLPDAELPIPPYSFGIWLADGDKGSARVSLNSPDDQEIVSHVNAEGVKVNEPKKIRELCAAYLFGSNGRGVERFDSMTATLRKQGVTNDKHIPIVYQRGSFEQRQSLLQGLMDGDGSVANSGQCTLELTNEKLSMGAIELIRSLGLKPTWNLRRAKLNGRDVGPLWRIQFWPLDLVKAFRLTRKAKKLANSNRKKMLSTSRPISRGRMITVCDEIKSVPVKCISVDSPSQMYLAGEGMIPTHNSPMSAGIGLLMLASDGEKGAEVYAAATTRDQARILFQDAVHMVDASPDLGQRIQRTGIRQVVNLAYPRNASFFRPVSSEGRGLDGKRVHCALIDELHEHPSSVVVDKMRAGTKGRRQAMIVEITNSGVDRQSVCYQHHEYSARVVSGQIENDAWFAFVCCLDRDDDPFTDESCWVKANPNIGVSVTYRYIREQVDEAVGMPAKKSIVQRLNFCQWVDAANPAIPSELWAACEVDDLNEEEISENFPGAGGLDLSGTKDLTAAARAYGPDDNGVVYLFVEFWTPKDTLLNRSREEQVPYDLWAEQGYIIATPGRAVDYSFVAQRMLECQQEYHMEQWAFDAYRIKYLEQDLDELNVDVTLIPHGQGFRASKESDLWMPRSLELFENLIGKGLLRVKTNPALAFNAASAVHQPDPKNNLIYDKRHSKGRIDGIVAGAMAVGALLVDSNIESIFDTMSDEDAEDLGIQQRAARARRQTDDDDADDDDEFVDQEILKNPRHPLWQTMRERAEAKLAKEANDFF